MPKYDYSEEQKKKKMKKHLRRVLLLCLLLGLLVFGLVKLIRYTKVLLEVEVPIVITDTNPGMVEPEPEPPEMIVNPDAEPPAETQSGEVPTNPGSEDWRTILVSAAYPLQEEMDMERVTVKATSGEKQVDRRIAEDFNAWVAAAEAAGHPLYLFSGYRTFETSQRLLDEDIAAWQSYGYSYEQAYAKAITEVAPPGTSEHNTGLAVDIACIDFFGKYPNYDTDYEYDTTAIWMKEHCAEYGFILRYPKGKEDVTGIIFEPWHFRYVGKEAAKAIMEQEITLEEYLGVSS